MGKLKVTLLFAIVLIILSGCSSPETSQTLVVSEAASNDLAATNTPEPIANTPLPKNTQTPTTQPTATQTDTDIPPIPEDILFSIGDPYARELGSQAIDVIAYDLSISLNPGVTNSLEGEAILTIQSLYTSLDTFALDFAGFEIEEVSIDGIALDFSRTEDKLIIETLLPYVEGEEFKVTIKYFGRPKDESSRFVPFVDHLGIFFRSASNVFVLSEPDGSHYWFPCNDHSRDKAFFRISITVPEEFDAIANGNLISSNVVDGMQKYVWQHDYPMSPYLAAFAVGYYEPIEIESPSGFKTVSYVMADTTPGFETEMHDVAEALDWFSEILGPYPYDTFGFVIVDGFGSSLETQSMVVLDVNMISEFVMIHELVHMWIGDWVGLDSWGEMWRNEGITNYFTLLWLYRDDPDLVMSFMEGFEQDALSREEVEPLSNLSPGNLFGYEAYDFAMLVTHKLRIEVGDDAFFEGIRVYLQRFGGRTASDADFIAVMEEISRMDLTDFFDYWLNYSSTSILK